MTAEQAKKAYIDRFGGFPEFLFMGADAGTVINAVNAALLSGKEIEPPCEDADY